METEFYKLCEEVDRSTRFLHNLKECEPHFQRVLDYILNHPADRDSIAHALSESLRGDDGVCSSVNLLQFLMPSLQWEEVRIAAERSINDGGNFWRVKEMQHLLAVFRHQPNSSG